MNKAAKLLWGGGGGTAQLPVLHVNEPKQTGSCTWDVAWPIISLFFYKKMFGFLFLLFCEIYHRGALNFQTSKYRSIPNGGTNSRSDRSNSAGIFKQSMGARNRVGIELSY